MPIGGSGGFAQKATIRQRNGSNIFWFDDPDGILKSFWGVKAGVPLLLDYDPVTGKGYIGFEYDAADEVLDIRNKGDVALKPAAHLWALKGLKSSDGDLLIPHIDGSLYQKAGYIGTILDKDQKVSPQSPSTGDAYIVNTAFAWQYRKKLAIDHTKIDGALTNFPVLMKLTSANFDFTKAKDNGEDIRFDSGDHSLGYKYEIERWDKVGEKAEIFVKIPSVAADTDTEFYMYYDNPAAADAQDVEAVWDVSHKLVQHMDDDPDNAHTTDSTSNNNDGTKRAANEPIEAEGKVGKAQNFDGVNDYDRLAENGSLNFGANTDFTIEMLIKPENALHQWKMIYSKDGAGVGPGHYLALGGSRLRAKIASGGFVTVGGSQLDWGTDYFVAVVADRDGDMQLYLNGAPDGAPANIAGIGNIDNAINAEIGDRQGIANETYKGLISELRVSATARSAAWIKATYHSLFDTLISFGSEESPVWSGHVDDIAIWNGQWVFITPVEGCFVYVRDEDIFYRFTDAGVWKSYFAVTYLDGFKPLTDDAESIGSSEKAYKRIFALNLFGQPSTSLIVNGNFETGNEYNFPDMPVFLTPGGIAGHTVAGAAGDTTVTSRILIPVNHLTRYKLQGAFKSVGIGGQSKLYFGLIPYTNAGVLIRHQHIHHYNADAPSGDTETTLAAQLNDGDMVVHLTDATNWHNGGNIATRYFAEWGHSEYPDYTLTHSVVTYDDVVGNDINLYAPWAGGTVPVGTAVANAYDGSGSIYLAAKDVFVPTDWTIFSGIISDWIAGYFSGTDKFWYGTTQVQIVLLLNYDQPDDYVIKVDALELLHLPKYVGDIITDGIVPSEDGTHDLGSAAKRYNKAYAKEVHTDEIHRNQCRRSVAQYIGSDVTVTDTTCDVYFITTGGANRTVNLPDAVNNVGRFITITKTDAPAEQVIIDPLGAQTIEGQPTNTDIDAQDDSLTITPSSDIAWAIVARNIH